MRNSKLKNTALLLSLFSLGAQADIGTTAVSSEVGYWSFSGGFSQTGSRDSSGNKHHGYFYENKAAVEDRGEVTLSGGQYTADGVRGTALDVNQDPENPLMVNIPDFTSTDAFSLSAWINLNELNTEQTLVEQLDSEQGQQFTVYIDSNNHLHISWINAGGSSTTEGVSLDPLPLVRNQWKHLLISFNSSLDGLYVTYNGTNVVLNRSNQLETTPINKPLMFGNSELNDLQTPLMGQLDEIRLFNRALSSIEAKCLTEQGFNCVPAFYQGPKGPRGYQGDTGLTGPTGVQGPAGARGENGETGEPGPRGAAGPIGPQGIKGDKGETGQQGQQGETGPEGSAGKDGIIKSPTIRTCRFTNPNEWIGNCSVSCETNEKVIGGGCKTGKTNDPVQHYYLKQNYPSNNGWYCEAIGNHNHRYPQGEGYAICMEAVEDEDSMQDSWERYYGLDPDANDAELDTDNDGMSNAQEFINGTNPIVADVLTVNLNKKIQLLQPIRHYVADDISEQNGDVLRDRSGTVEGKLISRSETLLDKFNDSEVPGAATKSFDFNGDTYLSMGSLAQDEVEKGFTWTGWFKVDSFNGWQRIFSVIHSVANEPLGINFIKNSNLIWGYWANGQLTPQLETNLISKQNFFLAFSYSDGKYKVFLNNSVINVTSGIPPKPPVPNQFTSGKSSHSHDGMPGSGGISDIQFQRIAIFDKALTQQQVAELYQLGSAQ